jgi:soluble lytic murein transglycosylase-like protein
MRKSLDSTSPSLTTLKDESSLYIGRVVEIGGLVSGTAKVGDEATCILESAGESVVVRAKELPDCIQNGTMVRTLVKIGPGSTIGLSDVQLQAVALDYDVSLRERQIADTEAKALAKAKARPAATKSPNRGSNPREFASAQQGRGANLSSRAMQVFDPYRRAIASFNPRLSAKEVDDITKTILTCSETYGVDPRLIIAIIITESGFRPEATSRCGAMGLCQLTPGTARGLGVSNAYDPKQNIEGSIKLIRGHLDKYGDLALALSAYNAGSGAVKKHGGVPPYRETKNYIRKVSQIYLALCGH